MVRYADSHISERSSFISKRSLKIYNSDAFICDLNEIASQQLNDRGCVMFDKMLKVFRLFEANLSFDDDGVREVFKKGGEKVYNTALSICNCTFTKEHQIPCRHITFLRNNSDEVNIFEIAIFHKRYHRGSEEEENEVNAEEGEPVETQEEPVMDIVSDLEEEEDSCRTLTDR